MKPARFSYTAPEDLDEALALLAEYGDDAKVLAGGQSLIPLMNLRLARPAVLVDVNRVGALNHLSRSPSGGFAIGATVRQAHASCARDLQEAHAILTHALRFVGHPGTRTRGTIGGSAAHADPAAELPLLLLTLDSRMDVARSSGRRTIPASDFFLSTFETALAEDELLTTIHLDPAPETRRWGYEHVARRHGDFALVAVAVTADVTADGTCRAARIGLAGVADVPVLAVDAAQGLLGTNLSEADAQAAGQAAAKAIEPPSDIHASAEYRRRLVSVLVERAVSNLSNGGTHR